MKNRRPAAPRTATGSTIWPHLGPMGGGTRVVTSPFLQPNPLCPVIAAGWVYCSVRCCPCFRDLRGASPSNASDMDKQAAGCILQAPGTMAKSGARQELFQLQLQMLPAKPVSPFPLMSLSWPVWVQGQRAVAAKSPPPPTQIVAFGGQDHLFLLYQPGAPRVDPAGCEGSC